MKKIIILYFLLIHFDLGALEIKCNFEEVYHDGSVQQGLVLIKNDKIRYEYQKNSLYTILRNNDKYVAVQNNDHTKFQYLTENNLILENIFQVLQQYPDIKEEYNFDDMILKIEKSMKNIFLKRISVNADNLKLSIFFQNCYSTPLNDIYFNFSPKMLKFKG